MTSISISRIIFALWTIFLISSASAQQQQCSCGPREYTFKLDFSGTCPPLPPPFPPNEFFGAGVNDYTCSVGDSPVRQLMELLPGEVLHTQNIADQVPVFISSIQFFQQDREGNPIKIDTVNNKRDGDTFRFISSIVTRPDQIPYRITMALRGFNAANESIQNTFTIEFTNKCGIHTFNTGEAIGWVIFDNLVPASDKTCPQFPSGRPTSSPTSRVTSMSYSSSLSISSFTTLTKTGKGKASKVTKGAKNA